MTILFLFRGALIGLGGVGASSVAGFMVVGEMEVEGGTESHVGNEVTV
jgi:hypothetical protein